MPDIVRKFPGANAGETSPAELLRECGEKLTDRALWTKFQERFQGLIFLYLLRALRYRSMKDDAADIVPDLAQEVYLRLVQNDGRILRSFRGSTEFSVMAFLSRISATVVQDHLRQLGSSKRRGHIVSIDKAKVAEFDRGVHPSRRNSIRERSAPSFHGLTSSALLRAIPTVRTRAGMHSSSSFIMSMGFWQVRSRVFPASSLRNPVSRPYWPD